MYIVFNFLECSSSNEYVLAGLIVFAGHSTTRRVNAAIFVTYVEIILNKSIPDVFEHLQRFTMYRYENIECVIISEWLYFYICQAE